MGGGHIAKKVPYDHNQNRLYTSYEELAFKDIQEILFNEITFDDHYNEVISTHGNTYKGMDKFVYGYIIKAFQTIVESKRRNLGKFNQK
jgi:hypothetical protein